MSGRRGIYKYFFLTYFRVYIAGEKLLTGYHPCSVVLLSSQVRRVFRPFFAEHDIYLIKYFLFACNVLGTLNKNNHSIAVDKTVQYMNRK